MYDMEASLLRAKLEASRADGISWGMRDDAIEENEVSLCVSLQSFFPAIIHSIF